jgi:hypothetical protein
MMPPNGVAARGSDGLRAAFQPSNAVVGRLRFKMATLHVADSLAVDQGIYTFELRAKPPAVTAKPILGVLCEQSCRAIEDRMKRCGLRLKLLSPSGWKRY